MSDTAPQARHDGTDGDDTIDHRYTGYIDTTYDGRGGDDTIWGGEGSDTYIWRRGDGNDVIREDNYYGFTDTLKLEGLNPDDITLEFGGWRFSDLIITIRGTDQTLTVKWQFSSGSRGIERIVFADGTTWDKDTITARGTVNGTNGDDTINHGNTGHIAMTYDGRGGDDTIYGGKGSDTYIWRRGDGNDVIWEDNYYSDSSADTLQLEGLNPDDITLKAGGWHFRDLIITIRGTDQTLTVWGQFSRSYGIEKIVFADGTTWYKAAIAARGMETVNGTNGDDTIDHSGTGNVATTYDGGAGDDTIKGGWGADTYIWRRGDGNDVIDDDGNPGDTDTLQLEGLNPDDVTLKAGGKNFWDLIITIRGTDQTLTVKEQFSPYGIEQIVFADGTTWDEGTIAARVIGTAFNGTDGDDTINHSRAGYIDTTYDGGGGDDTIKGGEGSDTYIWRRGDGNDVIREYGNSGDTDTLQLEGLNPADITLKVGGGDFSDLIITIRGTDQTLTVRGQFSYGEEIERIVFADGTTWDKAAIAARGIGTVNGTDGNDGIYHSRTGDVATTYDGRGGDDTIWGGEGSDTYIWRRGDGNDVIREYDNSGDTDTLQLEGLNPDDITLEVGGKYFSNLIITIRGTDQTLTVWGQFSSGSRGIEKIVFADGTTWDRDTITDRVIGTVFNGTDGDDTIYHRGTGDIATTYDGGGGDDTIYGGRGSDTYIWRRGDGNDVIHEYSVPGTDTLQLEGLNPTDITLKAGGRNFRDLILTIRGTDQTLMVARQFSYGGWGIEKIVFADGTTWDRVSIVSKTPNGRFYGTDGDDTIDHFLTGDIATTYDAGGGDDTIYGGGGSDTYIWRRGDGHDVIHEYSVPGTDTLKLEGLNPDEVALQVGGTDSLDLILTIRGSGETLTVAGQFAGGRGIEKIVFADGTTWDREAIVAKTSTGTVAGTDGDDLLGHTGDVDTTYDGRGGDDVIRGGKGSDTYVWRRGDGDDLIREDHGPGDTDTVRLAGLNPDEISLKAGGRMFQDLILTIRGTDQTLTVEGQFSPWNEGIEQIVFADGTTWDKDTIASKALTGTVSGTDGDDAIHHHYSGDIDTTYDGGEGNDTIRGGRGSDTYIWRRGDGNDVVIEGYGGGDTDTLQLAGLNPDDVTLKAGGRAFQDLILTIRGTDQTLTVAKQFAGGRGIEKIVFADGTTWNQAAINARVLGTVDGTNGDDTIDHRGTGDIDTTYALGEGDDRVDAGGGDDTLEGGRGSDTYVWRRGDGDDVVIEGYGSGDTDTLQLAGLNPTDITLKAGGKGFQDLILTIRRTGENLRVKEQFVSTLGIEKIVFADGTTWNQAAINARVIGTVKGTRGDDTIDHRKSGDIATTYDGGAGDDTVYGGRGSDTYVWRRGDGNDVVIEGYGPGDTDTVRLAGLNPGQVVLKVGGTDFRDLILTIRGTDQTLTITRQFSADGRGIEGIVFANGVTWTRAAILAKVLAGTVDGTSGDDTIDHGDTGDIDTTYALGDGDDRVDAGGGDDTLEGGRGSDTYIWRRGDGHDRIEEVRRRSDTDTLKLEGLNPDEVIVKAVGGNLRDLMIVIDGGAQTLTIENQFRPHYGIERIVFADGTTWDKDDIEGNVTAFVGTDGDDDITGNERDNIIDGGAGEDVLAGDEGADTFVFKTGDGHDVIEDFDDDDVIEFRGIDGLANFQDVLAKTSNDGDGNTLIAIDEQNSITLEGVTLAQLQQDDFRFV